MPKDSRKKVEEGYQPSSDSPKDIVRKGYQPSSDNQNISSSQTQQSTGKPPSGGSNVKPANSQNKED